jgi:membrane protease YdiL (CAAX protease family)
MSDPEPLPGAQPPDPNDGAPPLESFTEAPIAVAPQRDGAPWGLLDLIFTLMVVVGSLVFAQVAAMIVIFAFSLAGPGFHASGMASLLANDARFLMPVQLVSDLIVVAFVLIMAHVKYDISFARSLQWREPFQHAGLFLALGVGMAVLSQLVPVLFPTTQHFPIGKLFKNQLSALVLTVFGVGIAPFFEEMLFRGMVYPAIERRWGMEPAILGSAVLFASIHAPQLAGGLPQIGAIFLVGCALGYARGRTQSLAPSFWMHTSYNAALFAAMAIGTGGFKHFDQ